MAYGDESSCDFRDTLDVLQSIDELQVVDREKDDEIDRLRAEAVDAENKVQIHY